MEIERKWLAEYNTVPFNELKIKKSVDIEQKYLIVENTGEVRVRRKDFNGQSNFYMTIKIGKGISRNEKELEITEKEYLDFGKGCFRTVSKKRIETEDGFEIDMYRDSLFGLVTVEKEFSTVEEAMKFEAPSWCGRDITNDERFKNRNLSMKNPLKD